MTYNELLYDAIRFDEPKLAYPLYYLIKNGIVNGSDMYKKEMLFNIPRNEVDKLIAENVLGLNKIKLYSVPIGDNKHFILFAESEESARGHCISVLGRLPEKIIDISQKIDMSFWIEEKKKYQSLREIKEETLVFPSSVMIFEK